MTEALAHLTGDYVVQSDWMMLHMDCGCGDDPVPYANCPEFILSDIAAKRRIIEEIQKTLLRLEWTGMYSVREEGRLLLRLLAAPFSSHPDWQPEWSVE